MHRLIQTIGEEELPDGTLSTRYRFVHVLYQNAVYQDLMTNRRVSLHRQTGDLMIRSYGGEARRLATQLATHFDRGRDFERAVEFLVHAGDNAMQIHANEKAVEHYSRAVGFMPKLACEKQSSMLAAIYRKRGAAYLATGHFGDAIEDFSNLLHQACKSYNRAMEHGALNALAEAYLLRTSSG
ncbi:MAG TPA: hypothetical protein VFB14_17280 [Bryobacteraceae bacterium]|nr:hypothetical protein [Bryobacteraceae bacterium]